MDTQLSTPPFTLLPFSNPRYTTHITLSYTMPPPPTYTHYPTLTIPSHPVPSPGDRQARIAAAELLHSIITYMVGAAASAPKVRNGESKFSAMYSLVLPAAIWLSVCGDAVCQQLFHSLLFQVKLLNFFLVNNRNII